MITSEKLQEYKEYDGYYDGFYTQKVKKHTNKTTDEEWHLITLLMQDLELVFKSLASKEFEERVEKKLKEVCDSQETVKEFKEIAITLIK